jgi:chaperonin cofactor prefoldin
MKKIIPFISLILVLTPFGTLAKNSCPACQNSFAKAQENSSLKSQNATQNTDEEQAQEKEKIEKEVENSKPTYNPRSQTARDHMSKVAKAVEELISISYQIENQGLGDKIREIARAQNDDEDEANQAIDNAQGRGATLKFFLGPDYKELKKTKKVWEGNQQRINELNRILGQVSNEDEKTALKNQINTLEEQNTALKNQVESLTSGFSMLGWLSKIINKY